MNGLSALIPEAGQTALSTRPNLALALGRRYHNIPDASSVLALGGSTPPKAIQAYSTSTSDDVPYCSAMQCTYYSKICLIHALGNPSFGSSPVSNFVTRILPVG